MDASLLNANTEGAQGHGPLLPGQATWLQNIQVSRRIGWKPIENWQQGHIHFV